MEGWFRVRVLLGRVGCGESERAGKGKRGMGEGPILREKESERVLNIQIEILGR